jgi:hypothetical protein
MTPEDLQICREVHAGLTSNDRGTINYLFMDPVDLQHFTDYTSLVARPMDLRTLSENLESGQYATREEFYADAQLIFDNGVTYNKDKKESSFVVGLSKRMMKALERERKKAEKKAGVVGASGGTAIAADEGAKPKAEKKKKIKLSLKRGSSVGDMSTATADDASSTADSSASAPAPKPKIKLKMTMSKESGGGDSSASTTGSKKIKLKVKSSGVAMTPQRRAQCHKILSSLKRRQHNNTQWFLKPFNDPKLIKDYKEKVKDQMDLGTLQSK